MKSSISGIKIYTGSRLKSTSRGTMKEKLKLYQEDGFKEGENVSPRSFSTYLAPYHITANNIVYNGYKWNMAHYLDPIAAEHFLVTSSGGDLDSSPIYQNPGWPMTGGGTPQ